MQLSRMFRLTLVLAAASGAAMVACGGGGGSGTPDARKIFDAGNKTPDGPGSGSASSDLGKICTSTGSAGSGDPTLCTAADPECLTVGGPFFCSKSCGTGPCVAGGTPGSASCFGSGSNQPMPPAGGDAICMAQASSGTPICGLYGAGSGSGSAAVDWSCAILCGSAGSNNFGTCPPGLTCSQNFCQ